ncbi:diaminopimelate decarboxylase [Porticoccaceae bacterium LTM1]|nr:diaminopimelate decarboxylase [Porticoccaceae bacterium LTM1]
MNDYEFECEYGSDPVRVCIENAIIAKAAVAKGLLTEESPVVGFVDTDAVSKTIADLHKAFPAHFTHFFAVKANGMLEVLKLLKREGMKCETASPGELQQALNAGFTGADIVFDEPAKTPSVIKKVLSLGATLHVDNFEELERVKVLLEGDQYSGEIGYRINPQVGSGVIKAMSTAGQHSKFGVPLDDPGNREQIINDYLSHPWLNTMHTHVGSQGCSFELIAEGIGKVVALAKEVNQRAGEQRIQSIDIGGGLRVNFYSDKVTPTFKQYADFLKKKVPELFTGEFRVKTEFGRAIMAKNGSILARVEYAKNSGGRHIATTHAGAQIAARTIFMPEAWPLRLSTFDANGECKTENVIEQDIAGPCCFAGDVVAHRRKLPKLESGDVIMLHDTGAYYFSNPFFYNSLPAPAVYGYRIGEGGEVELREFRPQQTVEQMMSVIG